MPALVALYAMVPARGGTDRLTMVNHTFTSLSVLLAAFLLCVLSGCNTPTIDFRAETVLHAKGDLDRQVEIALRPGRGQGPEGVDLRRYLRLPAASPYEEYVSEPRQVRFRGHFESARKAPVDFVRIVPDIDLWAQNRLKVTRRDFGLFTTYDFEERLDDIVERVEAEEALREATGLLLESLLAGLEECFGADYDLEPLAEYLRTAIPDLIQRSYQIAWEIRRSRRGGVDAENPRVEFERRVRQEIGRYGLYLEPFDTPANRATNKRRAWEFLELKLNELAKPKVEGREPLSIGSFQGRAAQTRLLAGVEQAVNKSFGSLDGFIDQLNPLMPVFLGAFFDKRIQLIQTLPSFRFFYRLRLPGRIIQTNGLQDLDGIILWRFDSDDILLTGYPMWARSLAVDEQATERLGLAGFPGTLAAVERFHRAVADKQGEPDPRLVLLILRCVEKGTLEPLREAAKPPPLGKPATGGVSPQRAQNLLGFISAFHQPAPQAVRPPPLGHPETAPPKAEAGAAGEGEAESPAAAGEAPDELPAATLRGAGAGSDAATGASAAAGAEDPELP